MHSNCFADKSKKQFGIMIKLIQHARNDQPTAPRNKVEFAIGRKKKKNQLTEEVSKRSAVFFIYRMLAF